MDELAPEEIDAASARGTARLQGPRAERVHYDAGRRRVIVRLTTGVEIGFAPSDAQGLEKATVNDLKQVELTALGLGIHFPTLDADFFVPALLEGILGSQAWMAARKPTRPRRRAGSATAPLNAPRS